MKYLLVLTVIILGTISIYGANARCYIPSPLEASNNAQVVFVGKVISVTDPGLPAGGLQFKVFDLQRLVTTRFVVDHVYRGKKFKEIEVAARTGAEGYEFKVGRKYIVYAQKGGDNEQGLVVKECGRTRLVSDAKEDLKLLGGLSKPEKER